MRVVDPRTRRALADADVVRSFATAGYPFVAEVGRDRALLLGGYADEDADDVRDARGRPIPRRYNCALLREPAGAAWGVYRKVKLLPFGESMPGAVDLPVARGPPPAELPHVAGLARPAAARVAGEGALDLATFVCYEAIQPETVARLAGGRRPDLLVNLTNDSWYGDTWEPHQHLNFSRFRAVEHRAPLVRSTNTGISAFVSATGEVLASLPYDTAGELVLDVPIVARARTLYSRIARWSREALGGAALLVLLARMRARRRFQRATSASNQRSTPS